MIKGKIDPHIPIVQLDIGDGKIAMNGDEIQYRSPRKIGCPIIFICLTCECVIPSDPFDHTQDKLHEEESLERIKGR